MECKFPCPGLRRCKLCFGGVENARHVLLRCPTYRRQRAVWAETVRQSARPAVAVAASTLRDNADEELVMQLVDDEGRRAGGWDAAVGGCVAGEGGAVGGEGNGVVISRSSSIYFCLKWRSRSYHDVKYLFNKTHIINCAPQAENFRVCNSVLPTTLKETLIKWGRRLSSKSVSHRFLILYILTCTRV